MPDSRTALLTAAAEEFARHGLRGTRVQAVVKRAGVNERMIYHHFGSKEGLYQAVLAAERYGIGAAWAPYLEKTATMAPYEGMRAAFAALFDIVSARPRLVALLAHEWLAGAHDGSMPTADQLSTHLRDLYERGQREGAFVADRPFEVAYGITVGALVGLTVFLPAFAQSIGVDAGREHLRDHVISQLLDGLTGPR
ncbi:MAG: TetR/AcrR family transcriptional regulator [Micromonosporaceae bacterium]